MLLILLLKVSVTRFVIAVLIFLGKCWYTSRFNLFVTLCDIARQKRFADLVRCQCIARSHGKLPNVAFLTIDN